MRVFCQGLVFALLFFLLGVLSLRGQTPDPSAALTNEDSLRLKLFEARYQAAKSLQATFLERYLENGKLVRTEAGRVFFRRPSRMRWDYEEPEKSTFLVDGKYVWFYAPADRTATRLPVKRSQDYRTPLAFLAWGVKLARVCASVEVEEGQRPWRPEDVLYLCALRGLKREEGKENAANKALFELAPSGEVVRLVIPQDGGVRIEFTFKDWDWDPRLAESLFDFVPPRGSVIVDGLLPEAPTARQ